MTSQFDWQKALWPFRLYVFIVTHMFQREKKFLFRLLYFLFEQSEKKLNSINMLVLL